MALKEVSKIPENLEKTGAKITPEQILTNPFHEAISEIVDGRNNSEYVYPHELEDVRELLSSEAVKKQVKQHISTLAWMFYDRSLALHKKQTKNSDTPKKSVNVVRANFHIEISVDMTTATIIESAHEWLLEEALLSLYPELREISLRYLESYAYDSDNKHIFYKKKEWDGFNFYNSSRTGEDTISEPVSITISARMHRKITDADREYMQAQLNKKS